MPPGPALTPRAAEAARALEAGADPDRAAALHLHFRTGPGGYGAGDVFLGLTMPAVRTVARAFAGLGPEDVAALLRAREHEKRMAALLVACRRDERAASERERFAWAGLYLAGRAGVDNWDLVDASAPTLLGGEILRGRRWVTVRDLAAARRLWDRRMAVLATFATTRAGDPGPALLLAGRLLDDLEDLIHKAAGWMLREVGRRDEAALSGFLDAHAHRMPRTMLRSAVERLEPGVRRHHMDARRRAGG